MSLADDIAADWQHFDQVEALTLRPQNPTAAAIANVQALRMPLASRRHFPQGDPPANEPGDAVWMLFASTLGGYEPRPGDTLTEGSSQTWTILSATRLTAGIRWRAVCRRQGG